MKKNVLIAFVIIFTLSLATFAFASTTPATGNVEGEATKVEIELYDTGETVERETDLDLSNQMVFNGEEIKMSLQEVENLVMTSSSGIETAKINMAANKAKTESYYKSYSMTKEERPDFVFGGVLTSSGTEKEMAKLASNFAAIQSEKNYEAEINMLKSNTVKTYFELQQAASATEISRNNLLTQETILKNTNSKYKLGVVSNQDVLKAEIAYNQAKVDLNGAQSREALARMNYNSYFGFDLMQKVTLTDKLEVTEISDLPLEEAISSALENRNEITGAAFVMKYRELNLRNTGNNYAKTSSYYLQAKADLMGAEKNYNDSILRIEMDVRAKYMEMMNLKSSVELGKLSSEKATETYRLAKLQYDMGMATLTDVQMAQSGAFASQLQYSQSLLQFRLAVEAYEISATEGTYLVML